jgi:hypothetical protein
MSSKEAVLERLRNLKRGGSDSDAEIREEWLQAIDGLFKQIQDWLREAVQERLLEVSFSKGIHSDGRLGEYSSPFMLIRSPSGAEIVIDPKSRFLGGMKGRVDIECPPKAAILVRLNDGQWAFAELDPPHGWRYRPLMQDSFWEVLEKML